jgi:hypothetical protein
VANAALGVTEFEVADVEVFPLPLGVTVKVEAVPFVNPVMVQFCEPAATGVVVVRPATVQILPASALATATTVYSDAVPFATNVTLTAP